ncbi:MAG: 30S ribosomal protein S3 [Patescibacteria group bacterium]|jgi:small subunit ribosomal protein S3
MGQKINPISFRLQNQNLWSSRWFSKKDYGTFVIEDYQIRELIEKKYSPNAGIASINIERFNKESVIIINTSRPGILIGRSGAGVAELKDKLAKKFNRIFKIEIKEVKRPELVAKLVAENISTQLIKRINFRRAAKQAVEKTMQAGAVGVKIAISGRLNGAEMARTEKFSDGNVSLSTIKTNIDYALVHSHTTVGMVGVKVWINKGEQNADS